MNRSLFFYKINLIKELEKQLLRSCMIRFLQFQNQEV